jgi:hypothetical protein
LESPFELLRGVGSNIELQACGRNVWTTTRDDHIWHQVYVLFSNVAFSEPLIAIQTVRSGESA